ncbi:MAG TPA: DUF2079 domain-containing protein [Blastococcus sp.]|nr:DUF2079 domain-containing protein [Blastococcus sp.]
MTITQHDRSVEEDLLLDEEIPDTPQQALREGFPRSLGQRLEELWLRTPAWARGDRALTTAAFLGVLTLLLGFSLYQWSAGRNFYDGAYFSQAAWLISHGHDPIVTIRGVHMFADHAYFIFYPIAYLTRLSPDPLPVLLAVQAVALAAGVFPLALFARRVVGLGLLGTAGTLAAYALYPALHNVNAAEYHPESTAVPFILAGAYFCARRNWTWYFVCLGIVLLCREDLAIPAATAGVMMLFAARVRQGLVTVGVAGVALAVNLGFVIPHFAAGQDLVGDLYARYGGSTGALVRYTVQNPMGVTADLMSVGNLLVFIGLLAPVCFLALAGWRWALPALPLQVLYLLSSRESAHTILVQYVTQAIPFVMLGLAAGLGRLRGRRALALPLTAAAVITFLSYTVVSPLSEQHPWRSGEALAASKAEVAEVVPEGVAVSSTEAAWSVLAERRELFPYPIAEPDWLIPQPDLPGEQVCWAVVDHQSPLWETHRPEAPEWDLAYEDDVFSVYRSC